MSELAIEYRAVTELQPAALNVRKHSEAQVEQLAKSISEFGFLNPVLISEKNEIIAGHGRLMAAVHLGLERVPVVKLAHLSEEQVRAYAIADNQHGLNSTWDYELLGPELEELAGFDFSLEALGFNDAQFATALSGEDANNVTELWQDMPEFEQDNLSFRKLIVHFENQEAVDAFSKLVGQELTEKTNSIWHPKAEWERVQQLRYESEA